RRGVFPEEGNPRSSVVAVVAGVDGVLENGARERLGPDLHPRGQPDVEGVVRATLRRGSAKRNADGMRSVVAGVVGDTEDDGVRQRYVLRREVKRDVRCDPVEAA